MSGWVKLPFFKIYTADFIANTHMLTDAQVGKLMRALTQRAMGFPPIKLPENLEKIFENLQNLQNKDAEKYIATIERNQKIASTRRAPVVHQSYTKPEPEPEPEKKPTKKNPPSGNPQSAPLAVGGSPPPDRGDFGDFWEKWPKSRRSSRPKAQKSYEKAIKSGVSHAQITDGLQRHSAIWGQWSPEEQRYIPHPATWLNQERWNDPPPAARTAGRPAETHRQPPKTRRNVEIC